MSQHTLSALSALTTLVLDTGDINAICELKPLHATTNPSLVNQALCDIIPYAKTDADARAAALNETLTLGAAIACAISGRVSTEVGADLAYDTQKTLSEAYAICEAYAQAGIAQDKYLIKIPATEEGIKATRILEQDGVKCNVTLVFDIIQAHHAFDAGAYLISPFVGRISDLQVGQDGRLPPIHQDRGVQSVKNIYHLAQAGGYDTWVMAASFRSIEQILALAGLPLMTLAPKYMRALAKMDTKVTDQFVNVDIAPLSATVPFDALSPIANMLLKQGIAGFLKDTQALWERLRV